MTLAVYDKDGGNFKEAAQASAIVVFGAEAVTLVPSLGRGAVEVESLRAFSHIVCHLENGWAEPSWLRLIRGDLSRVSVIIRVSSQGANGMDSYREPYRLANGGPWVLHLIDGSGELTEEKWKELWQGIQQWNLQTEPEAALAAFFGTDHIVELWTLHVLCEASQMADSNPSGSIQKPSDWLGPFDQRTRPGGLFDRDGIFVHQRFMQARQAVQSTEPTSLEIADCLSGVIEELTTLKQIEEAVAAQP